MFDQHFLSSATRADVFGPLHGGERVMWRGRCGVAEYAFDEAASLPRWTLPETTDVLVTDQRVLYAYTADDGLQVRSGELRWLWPQHLRVQPGARSKDRGAAATQIQMVCAGADGTYPALVFAGGDLATVGDADRLANVIRQAVARFRVDNVEKLGLSMGQTRMLSRLLIGPEFRNHQGGEGQTVSLLGALLVSRPVPAPALVTEPADELDSPFLDEIHIEDVEPEPEVAQRPVAEGTRLIAYRPGRAADAARALMAAKAEEDAHQSEPATASRAADLAARVANLVSRTPEADDLVVEVQTPPADTRTFGARLAELRAFESGRHAEARIADSWHRPDHADETTRLAPAFADDTTRLDTAYAERIARERLGPERVAAERAAAERVAAERADAERFEAPTTTNLAQRAESIRRTAARMAANAARSRIGTRRADRETGISTRGNRTN
jgi:hypothetical protein